jgi:hypothetical protein
VAISRAQADALTAARSFGRLWRGPKGLLYCGAGAAPVCTLRTAQTLVSRGWMRSVLDGWEATREGLAVEHWLRQQPPRPIKRRGPRAR